MIVNRALFEAVYDWRCWRGQRVQYLVLTFGFSLVCVLLAASLRLGEMLFLENPPWAQPDQTFFTLLREHPALGFRPVTRATIAKLDEVPGVERVTWLSFRDIDLLHDRTPLPAQNVVFFDSLLPELTEAGFPDFDQSMAARSAWISERLFRQVFGSDPDIVGTRVRHERIPYPLTIAGVLGTEFNRIGAFEPDIWLEGSNLAHLTPFAMPPPDEPNPGQELRIRQFLDAVPDYYGIFTTAERFDSETVRRALEAIPDSQAESQVSFIDFEMQLSVKPGVDLAPVARQALRNQWAALVGLIIALAIVLFVNSVTIFASQWVLRWRDLNVMRVLGAGPGDFIVAQIAGLLPTLGLLIGLSGLMISWMVKFVETSPTYLEWAGTRSLDLSVSAWLPALIIVIVLLALCRALPMANMLRARLFTRAVGTNRASAQMMLGQGMLAIQLTGALAAVMIAGAMALTEWQHHRNLPLDTSVAEIAITSRTPMQPPVTLNQGEFPGLSGVEVAAVMPSLVGSGLAIQVRHEALANTLPVHAWHATRTTFSVLGIEPVAGSAPRDRSGIIINRSMAKLLAPDSSPYEVIGSGMRVETLGVSGSYSIVAIIEDLPHLGRAQRHEPAVYLPLENAQFVRSLTMLMAHEYAEDAAQAVNHWAAANLTQAETAGPRMIGARLDEADRMRSRLLYSALFVAGVISMLVLIGMIYQVRSRLALNQHEFGVRRAVGAPGFALIVFAARDSLIALAIATPMALLLQWALVRRLGADVPFDLFHPSILPVALLLIGLLVFAAAAVPVAHSLRSPIYSILRQD